MISDDLSALFAPAPHGLLQDFAVLLGRVTAFDPHTGANSINVFGTEIPNVPVLRVGSQSALTIGDTVLLGRIGNSFVVVGSIVQTGTANFADQQASYEWDKAPALTSFGTTTGVIVSRSVTVPSAITSFVTSIFGMIKIQNNSGATTNLQGQVLVSYVDGNGATQLQGSSVAMQTMLNGDIRSVSPSLVWGDTVNPGSVITAQLWMTSVGAIDGGAKADLGARYDWSRLH